MVRTPLVLPSTTREFVHVPVPGSPTLTTPPEMAFTVTPDEPEDDAWHEATWVDGSARLLIGPDGGAVQLANGRYRIWVRFTAEAERPVRNTGLLFIT
jgi:hypothetical protein